VPPLLFVASDSVGAKQPNYQTGYSPTALALTVPLAFFIAAWYANVSVQILTTTYTNYRQDVPALR
jgi:FHS family L-fucose permease-like MFS transporter